MKTKQTKIEKLVIANGLREQLKEDFRKENNPLSELIEQMQPQFAFRPWESTREAELAEKKAEEKLTKRNLEQNLEAQLDRECRRITGKPLS